MWRVWVKQWLKLFDSFPARHILRLTFVQYLIAFCSREEAASDVVSGRFVRLIVPDEGAEFCDPHFNRSGELQFEAIEGGIFDCIFRDNFRPKVAGDSISRVAAEWMSTQLGDSRSNPS